MTAYSILYLQPRGLLERLDGGEVVIGDGGFIFCMEKRGYVKSGPCTPEATVEHPEAGKTDLRTLMLRLKRACKFDS